MPQENESEKEFKLSYIPFKEIQKVLNMKKDVAYWLRNGLQSEGEGNRSAWSQLRSPSEGPAVL